MTNDNTANEKNQNHENDTCSLTLRFERNNSNERYPCGEYTVEVAADEVLVMVETDYQQRLATAIDPSLVERRDPNMILEHEVGRAEYNNSKSHHRNTAYRASTPRDESDRVSVIESKLNADGYLAGNIELADPADAWVTRLMVREALAKLDVEDRVVLVGIHMRGMTQTQVARVLGVSQPAVVKRLRKAEARLRELLS